MGGRALKHTETIRYSRKDFEEISKEVTETLKEVFDRAEIPRFFKNKETFGDLDIVVTPVNNVFNKLEIIDYIKRTFKPNEIFTNSNMISFDYKKFQVDLIFITSDNFDACVNYFSDNDLGNYIGNLAQSIGVKYGQEGLFYNYYDTNGKKNKIKISQDVEAIFNFLDLDYQIFQEGFDNVEDTFDFVIKSKYFNPDNYQLVKLTKINRERNLKRPNYMKFLSYVEDMSPNENYDIEVSDDIKKNILTIINNEFPNNNSNYEISKINYNVYKKKFIREKFNGKIIMRLTGLKNQELGRFIENYKQFMSDLYNFDEYIINSEPLDIEQSIFEFYNSQYKRYFK